MAYIEEVNELMTDATGQSIATAIGAMSATSVGNLSALTTTDKTSLVAAVNELNSNKQPKTDNNLTTTDKTTTGAINELKSGLTNAENSITILNANRITKQEIYHQTSAITLTFSGKGHTRVANMVLMLANQSAVYTPIPIMFGGIGTANDDITNVVVADNNLNVTASGFSITIPSNLSGWGTHLLLKLFPDDNITVTES